MDIVIAIIAFVFMLVPMIFLHELGHFVAAKLVGITVMEFGLGFPPRILKVFERNGTEYTLNWIPMGGFVRPLGEDFVRPVGDENSYSDRQEAIRRGITNPKSVSQAGPWQRIFFMSAGAATNFATALVAFVLMGLIGLPVVRGATVVIRSIEPDSPAAAAGLEAGDVITRIDDSYIESSAGLMEYLTFSEGTEVNFTVEGQDGNTRTVPMFVDDSILSRPAVEQVVVLGVVEDSPAGLSGLQPNDIILSGNGSVITSIQSLVDFTNANKGQQVEIEIDRAGEVLTVELTPRVTYPSDQGPIGIAIGAAQANAAMGFTLKEMDAIIDYEPLGFVKSVEYSLQRTGDMVTQIIQAPIDIIRGRIAADQARPLSIVAISQIGGQRLEQSVEFGNILPVLDYAAIISLALGLTNLLPIPGLDGGRIVFVVIELLRGKPMNPEREGLVHMVGLLLMFGVMLIFMYNDIVNPVIH